MGVGIMKLLAKLDAKLGAKLAAKELAAALGIFFFLLDLVGFGCLEGGLSTQS